MFYTYKMHKNHKILTFNLFFLHLDLGVYDEKAEN